MEHKCYIILLFVFQYYLHISEKIQAEGRAGMDEKSLYPFDESKLLVRANPQGGRGGTQIFSHIRRLSPFFLVQNYEFQYFLGFSEK